MDPHQFRVQCSVCGGDGAATVGDAADEWLGAKLAHNDPEVCRIELSRRRREMDREEKNREL